MPMAYFYFLGLVEILWNVFFCYSGEEIVIITAKQRNGGCKLPPSSPPNYVFTAVIFIYVLSLSHGSS